MPDNLAHAVDRLVMDEYDIVLYSDEQIVVKVADLVRIEGEEKAA